MPGQSVEDLVDRSGVVVARYVRGTRFGRPCAVRVEELGPRTDVAAALAETRPGWVVVAGEDLCRALVDVGARQVRHAHQMLRDLRADPPDPGWAALAPSGALRLTEPPTGRHAPLADLHDLAVLAYPPGHPDHVPEDDMAEVDDYTARLLRDRTTPMCPASALVFDGPRPVAALLVTHGPPGPWVGNVMRHPGARYAGLGSLLLRRGMAVAAGHGDRMIGLAVSHTNPARRLYESLGFRSTAVYLTVVLPGTP